MPMSALQRAAAAGAAAHDASARRAQAAADRRGAVGAQAHRHADAVARRRARVRRGDALRHDEQREPHRAVDFSRPGSARSPLARSAALTAGDKDCDPQWSPDGTQDRLHREAQGRRRAAGLPDRARRRRGAAADPARRPAAASMQWFRRRQAPRVRHLGVAGPRDRCAAGEAAARRARTPRSRRTSPSAASTGSGTTG